MGKMKRGLVLRMAAAQASTLEGRGFSLGWGERKGENEDIPKNELPSNDVRAHRLKPPSSFYNRFKTIHV